MIHTITATIGSASYCLSVSIHYNVSIRYGKVVLLYTCRTVQRRFLYHAFKVIKTYIGWLI